MPKDISEAVVGSTELVFPDDLEGEYILEDGMVYEPSEVQDRLDSDVPEYGDWTPVTDRSSGQDAWLSLPSQLLAFLKNREVTVNEPFRVVSVSKTGRKESDPYSVEVELPDRKDLDDSQASIETATDGAGGD